MSDTNQAASPRVVRITGWVFTLLGGALFAFGVVFLQTARESTSWAQTEGKIVSYLVRYNIPESQRGRINPHKDYYYTVTYSYTVAGTTLLNDRYSLGYGNRVGGNDYNSEEEARAAAQSRHPMLSSVSVWYNPEDPTSAVLETGTNGGTYVPLILGLLFLGIGMPVIKAAGRLELAAP